MHTGSLWVRMGKVGGKNKLTNKHQGENRRHKHKDSTSGFLKQQKSKHLVKYWPSYGQKKMGQWNKVLGVGQVLGQIGHFKIKFRWPNGFQFANFFLNLIKKNKKRFTKHQSLFISTQIWTYIWFTKLSHFSKLKILTFETFAQYWL